MNNINLEFYEGNYKIESVYLYLSIEKNGDNIFNQSCKRKVSYGTFRSRKVFITSENEDRVLENNMFKMRMVDG